MTDRERIEELTAALEGMTGMARLEAAKSSAWAAAVKMAEHILYRKPETNPAQGDILADFRSGKAFGIPQEKGK